MGLPETARLTRVLLLASLLATSVPAFAPNAQAQTVSDSVSVAGGTNLAEAKAAYNQGDIGKALPLFEAFERANPSSDMAHLWLAKALMKQGGEANYSDAKTHLIQALTINPDNPEALVNLGTITGWDASRRGEAISMLKHALSLKESSPYIQAEEATITRQLVQQMVWQGDYLQAAQIAQPMRQAFATETKWQALYANLLARMGQAPDAIPLYEEYIQPFEQPANPEVLQWRMDYLYALRYADNAPKARELFTDLAPTVLAQQDENLLNSLAGLAYDLGDYDTALEATQSLSPSLQAQRDIQLRTARVYVKQHAWPQAIAVVDDLYQQGQLTSEETLEFADVFHGQQVAEQHFPETGYVNELYRAAANSPKYERDTEVQQRIAQVLNPPVQQQSLATATQAHRYANQTPYPQVAPTQAAPTVQPHQIPANNRAIAQSVGLPDTSHAKQYVQTQPTQAWTVESNVMTNGKSVMASQNGGAGFTPRTSMNTGIDTYKTPAAQLPTFQPAQAPIIAPPHPSLTSTTVVEQSNPVAQQQTTHSHANVTHQPVATKPSYHGSYKDWHQQHPAASTPASVATTTVPTQQQTYTTGDFLSATRPGVASQKATPFTQETFQKAYATINPNKVVGEKYQFPVSQQQPVTVASSAGVNHQKQWEANNPGSLKTKIDYAKELTYDRQYHDALEAFDEVLQLDANNRDARLGKAYALLWSGRKYASKRIIEQLYAEYPNDIEVTTAMAEIHKAMGRHDKAIELLRQLRQRTRVGSNINSASRAALANLPVTWDFEPANVNHLAQWQLMPASYEQDSLEAELDALNSALANVEAIQADSENQLTELRSALYTTKSNLANPITELKANKDFTGLLAKPMQQYFGQTMTAYGDPSRGESGYETLPPYLDDQITNLENSLFDDLRPELRVGYLFQSQDGGRDTNRLSTWGVPNQVSFSLLPNLRLRGGVVPQRYYLPDANISPRKNFGLLYTAGMNFKPFDRVGFDGDIGFVRFTQSDKTNVNYRAVLTFDPWDRVRFKVGSRRLTLANSLLSISGFKPSQGAFAGQNLGPANETSVFGELNLLPFQNMDVNLVYEFAGITSDGPAPTSYKNQVYASAGYTHRFNDKHWARLGYQFLYMGFSRNTINGFYDVTSFGATNPVVSFGPVALADPGYDFGGYFSPDNFFLNALRLDYRGSLFDRFLEYQLGGSIGIQSYSHGNGIQDSSPTTMAYSADAAVRMNFTDWLSAYGRASFLDSGGFFSRYRLEAGLILRPYIEALSPVIGQKMPKSDDFRQRDSQFPFTYDIFQHYY